MADVKPKPARKTKRAARTTASPAKRRRWPPLWPAGRFAQAWRILVLACLLFALYPVPLLLIGRFVPTIFTPLMFIRLAEGETLHRAWTPLATIPPALPSMAIASEDQLFCAHDGFDWKALEQQFDRMQRGRRTRGASTISQQTAKNLFLWDGRNWLRKVLEAWYTFQMELLWPKHRIIEAYLNIAETGPGTYGVAAAARFWFKKDLSALSRTEMAKIIALLPAPRTWQPTGAGLRARARLIDRRAAGLGDLDACVR